MQIKHRFRNLSLEKVLDLFRSIKHPGEDFSETDQNVISDKNNPEKPRFYLANTLENETDIDYRKTNEGWHLACVHEVEYYCNDVRNLIYDWYIVVLDGGTFDCRIRGNKIVYDPKACFGHGHPNPTEYGSYGAALISKDIKTDFRIQSRQEPVPIGWRRSCTHEVSRNKSKIENLIKCQTFDDEIAVLGGYLTLTNDIQNDTLDETRNDSSQLKIVDEMEDLTIGNWSWEVGRFLMEKEFLLKNWQEKDESRSNMLIQRVYISPHHFYWTEDENTFLGQGSQ